LSACCPPSQSCIWTPGYDYQPCRQALARAPHAWRDRQPGDASPDPSEPTLAGGAHPRLGNQDGKLRWCTERRRLVVAFWLALANAAIVCSRLLRRAWTCYRWEGRPRRRP
jgi:hypothetical protein